MSINVTWLRCATFRLEVAGLVIYLDTYMDRPESAPDITDMTPVHEELARVLPRLKVRTMEFGGSIHLLDG